MRMTGAKNEINGYKKKQGNVSPAYVDLCYDQGRNEVKGRPRQEVSLAPTCLNMSSF